MQSYRRDDGRDKSLIFSEFLILTQSRASRGNKVRLFWRKALPAG